MSNSLFHNPQLVVITRPDFYDEEVALIKMLLSADSRFLLHLRKPGASADEYRTVLKQLPANFLPRITLGDHFELAEEFAVGGVHLSSRQSEYKGTRTLRVSRSCHSFAELENIQSYDYVFFSPIFNSISKQAYDAAFSTDDLLCASQTGLINSKVIALGGVDVNTLPSLTPYSFGGAAVLGTVWNGFSMARFHHLVEVFNQTFK